jgi:hypothetical protein
MSRYITIVALVARFVTDGRGSSRAEEAGAGGTQTLVTAWRYQRVDAALQMVHERG